MISYLHFNTEDRYRAFGFDCRHMQMMTFNIRLDHRWTEFDELKPKDSLPAIHNQVAIGLSHMKLIACLFLALLATAACAPIDCSQVKVSTSNSKLTQLNS